MCESSKTVLPGEGLEICQVSFTYPSRFRAEKPVSVLHDVTLCLPPGDIHVLLGPSGCGKSTLLQIVAGLLIPDSGKIKWNGNDLSGVEVHKRGFGLLFQEGQLFPHRSVFGNVSYGLEMIRPRLKKDQIRQRVIQMLKLVHLEGYENRRIETLSGGQAGRVALARGLATSPRLLLLDEPLSALDEQLRYELAKDIRKIVKNTTTTALYVTHDQHEATLVGDKISIMVSGVISGTGTLNELCKNNTAIKNFLGM